MAGQGIKLFVSGDVLSAAEINGYLMDQAVTRFASENARNAAFGGNNQPSLSEGRICYIDDLNLIQFYDGTNWQSSAQFTVGDGTITTVKLADDAVTGAKIADDSITSAHIAPGTVIASDIADGSITSAKILDGTIVNADLSASASIGLSKLESGTAAQIVIANGSGIPTYTTISGDVTIDSSGNIQVAADKIVNADINSSASIAYSKLSLSNSIVNADVNASAAIELGKLAVAVINEQPGSYTLVLADATKFIKMNVPTNATVTVPTNASVAWPVGTQIHIIRYGVGKTEIVHPGVIVYADPGKFLRATYSSATLLKCDTNTWVLMGDLSAS